MVKEPQKPITTSSPAGIDQHALSRPDHEKSHDEAAEDVNEESSVREYSAKFSCGETAQQITEIGADDRGDRNGKNVFHDAAPPYKTTLDFVGVISLKAFGRVRRLWRTPSP